MDIGQEITKETGFVDKDKNICTHRWRDGFIERSDLLTQRSQEWEGCRQAAANPYKVGRLFNNLESLYKKVETLNGKLLTGSHVANTDETGHSKGKGETSLLYIYIYTYIYIYLFIYFFFFSGSKLLKATRKKKYKGRSRQRAKSHSHCASVDLVSASGKHAKPFFVLKGEVKPRLGSHRVTEHGQLWDAPEGAGWSATESACMTDEAWEDEFTDRCVRETRSFLDEAQKGDYQALTLDGFVSRTSVFRALRRLLDAKIFLTSLPSHTSADLQPLDLTTLGPAKSKTDSERRKRARFYMQIKFFLLLQALHL